jgi:predicted RNA-binding Zn-ribbon protein involved in translation (DUF1610 family)
MNKIMTNYLEAYKSAIDEEKKSMTEPQLAAFEQKLAEERKLIEEHEKTMVRHDDTEFIMDERGISEADENGKYPEADDPNELMTETEYLKKATDKNILDKQYCEQPDPYASVVKESDIKTERIDVRPVLVKGYCPKCGKEIVSVCPPMYNPFTFEKRNVHKCGNCGWTGNLEYSYPRIVFVDANNNEYEAYTK